MFITSVSDFDAGMSPSSAVAAVTSEPDSSGSQAHRLKGVF